jgi:hypothetical protein
MRTLSFSRHNTLICTDEPESLDVPDADYRAQYVVWSSGGRMLAEIQRVERNDNGVWKPDRLSALEIHALEASIERAAERRQAEDSYNVREVAAGY